MNNNIMIAVNGNYIGVSISKLASMKPAERRKYLLSFIETVIGEPNVTKQHHEIVESISKRFDPKTEEKPAEVVTK